MHGRDRTVLNRHEAQTETDRQRRITESFTKAVEQLAHQDIEVRLGGIYTLERISKKAPMTTGLSWKPSPPSSVSALFWEADAAAIRAIFRQEGELSALAS